MQTQAERPRTQETRIEKYGWQLRDIVAGSCAVVVLLLLIWSLAVVSSVKSNVTDLQATTSQQGKAIGDLNSLVSDNERQRQEDNLTLLKAINPRAFDTTGMGSTLPSGNLGNNSALPTNAGAMPSSSGNQ